MVFEDLKCSLVEETEPEFSLSFFGSALFHLFYSVYLCVGHVVHDVYIGVKQQKRVVSSGVEK